MKNPAEQVAERWKMSGLEWQEHCAQAAITLQHEKNSLESTLSSLRASSVERPEPEEIQRIIESKIDMSGASPADWINECLAVSEQLLRSRDGEWVSVETDCYKKAAAVCAKYANDEALSDAPAWMAAEECGRQLLALIPVPQSK